MNSTHHSLLFDDPAGSRARADVGTNEQRGGAGWTSAACGRVWLRPWLILVVDRVRSRGGGGRVWRRPVLC